MMSVKFNESSGIRRQSSAPVRQYVKHSDYPQNHPYWDMHNGFIIRFTRDLS